MSRANYKIESQGKIVNVALAGVYSLSDVKSYEIALKKHVFQNQTDSWFLVADVNALEASAMDAVKYTENITNWILDNNCLAIINVHNINESIVDFQLAIAAGKNKIYSAKTEDEAIALVSAIANVANIAV